MYVCRGGSDPGGDCTDDDLKSNRTINQQALVTGWSGGETNARGDLLGSVDVPCFWYLTCSRSAACSVCRSLSLTVFGS